MMWCMLWAGRAQRSRDRASQGGGIRRWMNEWKDAPCNVNVRKGLGNGANLNKEKLDSLPIFLASRLAFCSSSC